MSSRGAFGEEGPGQLPPFPSLNPALVRPPLHATGQMYPYGLTSAKFLAYYCLSVILLLRVKE